MFVVFFQGGLLPPSPTEVLLRYMMLPDDEVMEVDLRQCAVLIMSHLDRLATPFMPPTEAQKV